MPWVPFTAARSSACATPRSTWPSASIYGPMQITTTASLATNFLAQARPGHDLIAHAVVLKPGKRIVYGEVHVYSGERSWPIRRFVPQ